MFFFFFVGCENTNEVKKEEATEQPDLTNEEMKRLVLLDTSYAFTESQIKDNALYLAEKFLNQDGIKRSIAEVKMVPSHYTLTGKTEIKTDFAIAKPETPSLYAVNFNDNHGYVLLSGDKRVPHTWATVAAGTLDDNAHIGLQIFMSDAIITMDTRVAEVEATRGDSIFNSMVSKLQAAITKEKSSKSTANGREEPCLKIYVPGKSQSRTSSCGGDCFYRSSTVVLQTVNNHTYVSRPLLSTLWDQGPPYNNGQPDGGCNTRGDCGNNSRYLAGCVAIAESQVVAHYYAKRNNQWQDIVNKPCNSYTGQEAEMVANLNHSIYLDYGIYVSRQCGSTGAGAVVGDLNLTDPRGISPKYGLVEGEWRDWNTGDVRNSLANGSPVVTMAFRDLCCVNWGLFKWPCWGCGGGHEWVVDGMRDESTTTTYRHTYWYEGVDCTDEVGGQYTYSSTTTPQTKIHQNWGWGPRSGSDPSDWYSTDYANGFNHQRDIVAYITQQ